MPEAAKKQSIDKNEEYFIIKKDKNLLGTVKSFTLVFTTVDDVINCLHKNAFYTPVKLNSEKKTVAVIKSNGAFREIVINDLDSAKFTKVALQDRSNEVEIEQKTLNEIKNLCPVFLFKQGKWEKIRKVEN